MAIQTLTGGEFEAGSAQDNTQRDTFQVYGAGNDILTIGGDLTVMGGTLAPFGQDTGTGIYLSDSNDIDVKVSLNGGGNLLDGRTFGELFGSTVNYTVGASGATGGNTVLLSNIAGSTTLNLSGAKNSVVLNGDATNKITSAGGSASILVGGLFDDTFGWNTSIVLGGTKNDVKGGDENFTIRGGQGVVFVGDGENTITMAGSGNSVTVGGGDNIINAGGGGSTVTILGTDGANSATASNDGDDASPISPTDDVTIAGANNVVTATYENVFVSGVAATTGNKISLGDGNNSVRLGGTGKNTVTVGNGSNAINVSGASNVITVGDGPNGITLAGNSNTVTVIDPTGVGLDTVQLGAGQNDTVALDHAGGSVVGTATAGVTTVTQVGPNAVKVTLSGTGNVSLGDGKDTVSVGGANSVIKVGNGADTITANGNGDKITTGNGSSTITANGSADTLVSGNGNNTIQANGAGDSITVGNGNNGITANGAGDKIAMGSGSNTLVATGTGDTITANPAATSKDNITIGSLTKLSVTGGVDTIQANGAGDTFALNHLNFNSVVTAFGNGSTFLFGSDSSALLHLNPSSTSQTVVIQSLGGAEGMSYSGKIEISGFEQTDKVDLQSLAGADGSILNNAMAVVKNTTFGPTQDVVHFAGGGSLAFDTPTAFNPLSVAFTNSQGPVHV